jgi:hypothetical protein
MVVGCCRAAFDAQGFRFRDPACHRQPQILSAEFALKSGKLFEGIGPPKSA